VPVRNIVFDFGGVLIDWNPRYLYRKIFNDENKMEHFLAHVCTQEWNERHDEGHSFLDNGAELIKKFPDFAAEIHAYRERWGEMINGPMSGTPEILERLKKDGRHRLFGLTNWSAETFGIAEEKFAFLKLFEGIVVSGRIGLKKPDPRIFQHLCERYQIEPGESLFIDDNLANVRAAAALGFHTEHFRSAEHLAERLK